MILGKTLEALVQHHLSSFSFYKPHSSVYNDLQILNFVRSNILGMSPIYRFGVFFLLAIINFLSLLTQGTPLTHLSAKRRAAFIDRLNLRFPFDLLNKLICGNIYLRLFEITSGPAT